MVNKDDEMSYHLFQRDDGEWMLRPAYKGSFDLVESGGEWIFKRASPRRTIHVSQKKTMEVLKENLRVPKKDEMTYKSEWNDGELFFEACGNGDYEPFEKNGEWIFKRCEPINSLAGMLGKVLKEVYLQQSALPAPKPNPLLEAAKNEMPLLTYKKVLLLPEKIEREGEDTTPLLLPVIQKLMAENQYKL